MNTMKNKVAYITGDSKGIGLGIARTLLEAGMKVAISGRNTEAIEQGKKDLGNQNIIALTSDVRNFEHDQKRVHAVIKDFGRIDLVIANVGLGRFAPVHEMSLEDWNAMIDTQRTGVSYTISATAGHRIQNKGYYILI